ncbi:MAG: DUF1284 domain-containing protein [Alphaproteobacteria bacterium]|nr:DUF1284 domain-containing protein [Alphaproteobacteria bacterium]
MPEGVVRLRGHHFLCILSFVGKGYTDDFVDNMRAVVAKIGRGAEIEIIAGPDDICDALRRGAAISCAHARVCRAPKPRHEDRLALRDAGRILHRHLKIGDRLVLTPRDIAALRLHFAHGAIRRACTLCPWKNMCTGIAESGFAGAVLFPPEKITS